MRIRSRVRFKVVGFLKIFAQAIGISTPPSSRRKEGVERRTTIFKQREVLQEEEGKDDEAQ
jgi:hypothetical protein